MARQAVKLAQSETDYVPAGWPIETIVVGPEVVTPPLGYTLVLEQPQIDALRSSLQAQYNLVQVRTQTRNVRDELLAVIDARAAWVAGLGNGSLRAAVTAATSPEALELLRALVVTPTG